MYLLYYKNRTRSTKKKEKLSYSVQLTLKVNIDGTEIYVHFIYCTL